MSIANPAIRTDSNRTPVLAIAATSSREITERCSSVSSRSSPATLSSSSGRSWPSPTLPGTASSGSTTLFRERADSLSTRSSVDRFAPVLIWSIWSVAGDPAAVGRVVVIMPESYRFHKSCQIVKSSYQAMRETTGRGRTAS